MNNARTLRLRDLIFTVALLAIISMPLWVKPLLGIPSLFAVVEGRSMEPILHTGDLVLILPRKPENIHVGDVVVYKKNVGYVIHRVVYIYKHGDRYCYVTWGDNRETNRFPDFGDPSQCGTVAFADPYTGKWVTASGIPYSRVVGVVISIDGHVFKIPYIGSLTLALKR